MVPRDLPAPGAQHRQSRSGQARDRRSGAGVHAGRGSCPPRRRARNRQDQPREGARRDRAGNERAHPVHARPAALGCHRRHDLRPAVAPLRVPQGADLRVDRARGRDQPRLAEDAVGPPRGDGGVPRHRRRRDARDGSPVPRDRHPEPDRAGGNVQAAGGAARPVPDQDVDRLPRPRGDRENPGRSIRPQPVRRTVPDHHDRRRRGHGRPCSFRARRARRAPVRGRARRGDPQRSRDPPRRLGAWRDRDDPHRQGVGGRPRASLRPPRRHQDPRASRVAAPSRCSTPRPSSPAPAARPSSLACSTGLRLRRRERRPDGGGGTLGAVGADGPRRRMA